MDYFERVNEFLPWKPFDEKKLDCQLKWQERLKKEYPCNFAKNVFVSEEANIFDVKKLDIGENSKICAGVLLRSIELTMGENCTINTFSYLQGNIKMGSGVRIAPRVSIIAMNHGIYDTDTYIHKQPVIYKGIEIGDDVWIGAGAIILDGVKIGSHTVIGAGSVVTKDIGDYKIAVGNPAKVVKDRLKGKIDVKYNQLDDKLRSFCEKVKSQIPDVLASYVKEVNGEKIYLNHLESQPTTRAWCDAVEISALFGFTPPLEEKEALVKRLKAMQTENIDYNVLCVGYALELLGEHFEKPFNVVENETDEEMYKRFDNLPWALKAWSVGSGVDHYATALYFNKKYFDSKRNIYALFGYLNLKQDKTLGVWGSAIDGDLLQPVNGYYRLTRGSYAQFNVPVPNPEVSIDTILRHTKNVTHFSEGNMTACKILDIIHPLWLCARQTHYRKNEGDAWAYTMIETIISKWQDGKGFSFELEPHFTATLQGIEMFLAILYILCEYVGKSYALSYKPNGIHRMITPPLS